MSNKENIVKNSNIYSTLDNELSRLHELYKHIVNLLATTPDNSSHQYYSHSFASNHDLLKRQSEKVFHKIMQIQDLVMDGVVNSDKQIQEIIAEMALTNRS